MTRKQSENNRRRSRLWKWILFLPLWDVRPGDMQGKTKDPQVKKIKKFQQETAKEQRHWSLEDSGSNLTKRIQELLKKLTARR